VKCNMIPCAAGGESRSAGGEMRGQKEHQDKGQNESPDGSLPVIELQTQ